MQHGGILKQYLKGKSLFVWRVWWDVTGSSLDVILKVLPKRVLEVLYLLGAAAHLITRHIHARYISVPDL